MASTGGATSQATIASAKMSATALQPPNLRRSTASLTGPLNKNGALTPETTSGGQSGHRDTETGQGLPQVRHQGLRRGTTLDEQASQKGHSPDPHAAHRRG